MMTEPKLTTQLNQEISTPSSVYKTLLNVPRADYASLVTETVMVQKTFREVPVTM